MSVGPEETRNVRSASLDRSREPPAADTALVRLTESIREEWESRHQGRSPASQFGLSRLFGYADVRKAASSDDPSNYMQNQKLHELPSHWVDRTGQSRALDNAFFEAHEYVLADLLAFEDAAFVEVAYRCLLKRLPDERGFANFLQALRVGSFDRIDILGSLANSAEGRSKYVVVSGLKWLAFARRSRRAPYLGPVLDWVHAVLRLSRLRRDHLALEARSAYWQREQTERLDAIVDKNLGAVRSSIEAFEASHEALHTTLSGLSGALRRIDVEMKVRLSTLEGRASAYASKDEVAHAMTPIAAELQRRREATDALGARSEWLVERITEQLEATTTAIRRLEACENAVVADAARLSAIEGGSAATFGRLERVESAARKSDQRLDVLDQSNAVGAARFDRFAMQIDERLAPVAAQHARENFTAEEARSIESFYAGLEARFRGERADIIARFEPYLPFILDAGWGAADAPVLDLACGRGEWLELLKTNNIHAYGIDASQVMVDHCRAVGVVAEQGELLSYLEGTRSEAFGVVSAMHIVEHLPFAVLVRLIREIHRTLKPGGLLIFETPNPENLFVAAYAFRMDPTHRTPLPPPMLEYLVESQGFERPTVLRLNAGAYGNPFAALPADGETGSGDTPQAAVLQALRSITVQHYYSAPDFAVIGRKPAVR